MFLSENLKQTNILRQSGRFLPFSALQCFGLSPTTRIIIIDYSCFYLWMTSSVWCLSLHDRWLLVSRRTLDDTWCSSLHDRTRLTLGYTTVTTMTHSLSLTRNYLEISFFVYLFEIDKSILQLISFSCKPVNNRGESRCA